jgi:hypothetical protein
MYFAQAAPPVPADPRFSAPLPWWLIIIPILILLFLVAGIVGTRYRWYRTVGIVLGALLGGLGGVMAARASGTEDLKALCIETGTGFGAVAGAIVGCTSAILDAINRDKRSH